MQSNGHHVDSPSPDQAAERLGVSERTVRRMIARGELEGTREPYSTTRAACDALRRRQQGQGSLYSPPPMVPAEAMDTSAGLVDTEEGTALMVALAAELAGARDQIERLARENGRLAALLEQSTSSGPHTRTPAQRLVRWLLR